MSPAPDSPTGDTQPVATASPKRGFRKRWIVLLGILGILLMGAAGSLAGYQSAVNSRLQTARGQIAMEAATQYNLGVEDQKSGRLEIAQQRFEYVISLDPEFPGVQESLTQVMVALQLTAVPTDVPEPTAIPYTPTPDTRDEQQMTAQILQDLADHKWNDAITTIEALRAHNLEYQAVAVDGYYYIALRGRGVDKILKTTDLEGGIYDLTLAERFGPLDKDAIAYQTWARTYLTGASFWEVDWEKAVYYFSQVYNAAPSLMDGTKMTSLQRYKYALVKWGDKLLQDDPCKAAQVYQQALQLGNMATIEPGATEAARRCAPPTDTPQPTKSPTATPTPTSTGTLELPTPGDTATPTPPPPTAAPTTEVPASPTPTLKGADATHTPVPPTATHTPTSTP